MYKVEFCFGESRYSSDAVDYMMVLDGVPESEEADDNASWEDFHLYAEVPVDEEDIDENGEEKSDPESRHYYQLKNEVIEIAQKYGIPSDQLKFQWD